MKKRERIREQVRPFGLGERDYKNFRFVNLADCTAKKRASRNVWNMYRAEWEFSIESVAFLSQKDLKL